MKTLKFMLAAATAIGLASASQADVRPVTQYSEDFESATVGTSISTNGTGFAFLAEGCDVDDAKIAEADGNKYLNLELGTDPLLRALDYSSSTGAHAVDLADSAYPIDSLDIETRVQFTVTPYADSVTANAGDKLMIYLKEMTNVVGEVTGTNLMVKAAHYVAAGGDELDPQPASFTSMDVPVNGANVVPGQWYDLKVRAKKDADNVVYFNIWIGNAQLATATSLYPSDVEGYNFPSLLGDTSATLTYVGFAGSGKVDDLVFTRNDLVTVVDFTLALSEGVTSIDYTIKEADGSTIYTNGTLTSGTFSCDAFKGQSIWFSNLVWAPGYNAGSFSYPDGLAVGDEDISLTVTPADVAQINSGTTYTTLKAAVDAAVAGDTVTVLADCSVAAPITFTKGISLVNNYMVDVVNGTYAYRFFNGTESPVTISGTGTFKGASDKGSQFLVGSSTNKTSHSIGVVAGNLILNGCTVTNGQSNVVKVEFGSFTMTGGTIDAAGLRGVKVDTEDVQPGTNCTATVTINGGVINSTGTAVATASKADNGGTSTATINGGYITGSLNKGEGTILTIPGTSAAKFSADQTAFCADGYKTVQNGDWFEVAAKVYYTAIVLNKAATTLAVNETETLTATLTPASAADDSITWTSSNDSIATVDANGVVTAVAAGEATITVAAAKVNATCTVTVTAGGGEPEAIVPSSNVITAKVEAASAEAAIAAVTVTPPAGVDAAAYKALFNISAAAVPGEAGQFNVFIEGFKDSVIQAVSAEAVDVFSGDSSVAVPAGLYYRITPSTDLSTWSAAQTGASEGTVTVTKPGTTKGFLKVEISTVPFTE